MLLSRRILGGVVVTVLAFGLVTATLVLTGAGGGEERALRSPAPLAVSPTGSDGNRCTRAAPCRTFARALARARPGQEIVVAGGRYPGQTLPAAATRGRGERVVLRAARGARVRLSGMLVVRASGVDIRRLAAPVVKVEKARNVVLRDLNLNVLLVHGARRLSVLGGDIGPSVDTESQVKSFEGTVSRRIRFVGVRFHDARKKDPEAHVECLQIGGVAGLVIRDSTFTGCADHDIFIRSWGRANGSPHPLRDVLIEGNRLGRPTRGHYSLRLGRTEGWPCVRFTIRENIARANMYSDCDAEKVVFERNVQPTMAEYKCNEGGAVWRRNLYSSGVRCGPGDRVNRRAFAKAVRRGILPDWLEAGGSRRP